MAPSETSIANAALVMLGERRINSLNDPVRTARIVSDRFDPVRDELLRSRPWAFATKRAELPEDAATPLFGFARQYTLPVDCLRVLEVDAPIDWRWRVEGRKLLTSCPAPLAIAYTARVDDPREMDSLFRQAFAAHLAFDICEAITGSSEKLGQVSLRMQSLLAVSGTVSGQESAPRQVESGVWEQSRGREEE